jgi:hypothetical protein
MKMISKEQLVKQNENAINNDGDSTVDIHL